MDADLDTTDRSQRRSDGAATHAAILDAAVRIASIEGLGSLTIGRLARDLGISKSGVFAHFASKVQLQRETIQAARVVFEREVVRPTLAAPEGLRQVEAFCEAYLGYVERGVFPGGCFFAHVLAEFDAQDGPIHAEVVADQRAWRHAVGGQIELAKRAGEIAPDVDGEQLAFELLAALDLSNFLSTLERDPNVVERGRRAVRAAIARARAGSARA
jgi:AcrR family transcriptional regulator